MKNFEEIKIIVDKANKYLKGEETDPLFYENFGDNKTVQDMTKLLEDKPKNELGLEGKKFPEKLMILYLFSKVELKKDVCRIFEAIDENLGSEAPTNRLEKIGRLFSFANTLKPKLAELTNKKHELDDNSRTALKLIGASLQSIVRLYRPKDIIKNLSQKIESNIEVIERNISIEEDRQKGCLDRFISKLKGFFYSSEPKDLVDQKLRDEAKKLLEGLRVKTNLFSKFFSRHYEKNESINIAIDMLGKDITPSEFSDVLNSAKKGCYENRTSLTRVFGNKFSPNKTPAHTKIAQYMESNSR